MRPLALCLLVLAAAPAQAGTGDCDSPAYMAQFPDAASAADWAVTPAIESGVERGVRAAIAALAQLGAYRIDDVTILLLDDTHSFDSPEVLAETDGRRDRTGARGRRTGQAHGAGARGRRTRQAHGAGDCLITLYTLVGPSAGRDMAVTAAHGIFHGVQYASLGQASPTW